MSVKVEVPMIGLQVSELRQSTTVILNVICQYRSTHDAVCVSALQLHYTIHIFVSVKRGLRLRFLLHRLNIALASQQYT